MVFCIQATVALPTEATRDEVRAKLIEERDRLQRWGAESVERVRLREGEWGLRFTARFTDRTAAQQAYIRARDFINARNPNVGSRLVGHTCTHDEGTNECTVVARRDW